MDIKNNNFKDITLDEMKDINGGSYMDSILHYNYDEVYKRLNERIFPIINIIDPIKITDPIRYRK